MFVGLFRKKLTGLLSRGVAVALVAALSSGLLGAYSPASASTAYRFTETPLVAGIGFQRRVEGAAEEAVGKTQSQFGKAAGQVEGTTKQVEGRAKRDIGRVEQAGDKIRSEIEDAADTVTNTMRDLTP